MLALGIDTSTAAASLGLADERGVRAELNLKPTGAHAEHLVPAIRALLDRSGLRPTAIERFAVASGPGSFTGLRIGMATARGLAMAVGRPLVGFSTLETTAMAAARAHREGRPAARPVCVLLDAGRGEVYRGIFRCEGARAEPLAPEAALAPERAAAGLPPDCLFCGGGVGLCRLQLEAARGGGPLEVVETPFIGAELALRAVALGPDGSGRDLPPLIPNYLRLSDAEITFKG